MMQTDFRHIGIGRLRPAVLLLAATMLLAVHMPATAGIVIGGSVYGGGEGQTATVNGNAAVTVTDGIITTSVFGGAYMANVNGYAYVNIYDTLNHRPVIANVFGGNDIAGNILNSSQAKPYDYNSSYTPRAFVRVRRNSLVNGAFIGELYGGGNGNYSYIDGGLNADTAVVDSEHRYAVSGKPDLAKALIDIQGGTIGHVYGGGCNATVTDSTIIWMHTDLSQATDTIPATYLKACNDSTGFIDVPEGFDIDSVNHKAYARFTHQVTRMFGGNNLTAMSIRPTWKLEEGSINRLYSGGNKGDMTHPQGIYLYLNSDSITVGTVFGGCRIADVNPSMTNGVGTISEQTLDGFSFHSGHSTKLRIAAGKITDVYGGNDIAGNVYFGSEVVIQSDIINDVYGGGNGSYKYVSGTSNTNSDYWFDNQGKSGTEALALLNEHRPNCENADIHLESVGTDTIYVGGSVYCGGNSATLKKIGGSLDDARSELHLGKNVILNSLYMGSNGEYMVQDYVLGNFARYDHNPGIDLRDSAQMSEYMKGVEVSIKPVVDIDDDVNFSSKIGSFYCGGNVGSMSAPGTFSIDFLNSLVIFEKLVAGCNNANVPYRKDTCAFYQGGLTTKADTKVALTIKGLRLEPRHLEYDAGNHKFNFTWNVIESGKYYGKNGEINGNLYEGFLYGGNIYGGCFESGYVNGDVRIDILDDAVSPDLTAHFDSPNNVNWDDHVYEPLLSTVTCYGGGYGEETEIWGNTEVSVKENGHILKLRAGSERGWIGQMERDAHGIIVKDDSVSVRWYNRAGSSKVPKYKVKKAYDSYARLDANILYNAAGNMYNNVGEIVAGGFEGVVTGNTHAIIDNGCTYTVFGGASNAHVYGSAEVILGENGFPYISQTVYGGNDFGGQIMGASVHNTGLTAAGSVKKVYSNTYVEYLQGDIGNGFGETVSDTASVDFGIFGGAYGWYDYRVQGSKYWNIIKSQPNLMTELDTTGTGADLAVNCFVNIASKSTEARNNIVRVYGGGQGGPGDNGFACVYNSYVLLNAKNSSERGANGNYIADYVYGAGDCSTTWHSRVDAYGGYVNQIHGGSRSRSLAELTKPGVAKIKQLSYMGETSTVNVYEGYVNRLVDIYGGGAYAGVQQTEVNLYGGKIHDVYGGSVNEGITYMTHVNVPSGSKAEVNALYGGSKGNSRGYQCDTYISKVDYHSADASVAEAIYGGNNDYRMTRNSFIDISVPVTNTDDDPIDVFGAGKGANTFAVQTNVNLQSGAKVGNVYGGGQNGEVLNEASMSYFMFHEDYLGKDTLYLNDSTNVDVYKFNSWKSSKSAINGITLSNLTNLSLDTTAVTGGVMNTNVSINEGATVLTNAYGGGYGSGAVVAGQTSVDLLGGIVSGNTYGGGYGGDVMQVYPALASTNQVYATNVNLTGGSTINSYGGGYQGNVVGTANTIVGLDNCGGAKLPWLDGDPTVERSLYGGGENGAVDGTANLIINNGHIGYAYDTINSKYVDVVDFANAKDSILYHNGNVFGGGYGEGAYTIRTNVRMYDGQVRNSLYGGGEIASIGVGTVDTSSNNVVPPLDAISKAGETHVYMYGGHVLRNVFGGGRGYSYDLYGNQIIGYKFYTDGYVFGKTDANIFGGEIGTAEGVADGYGNVFGGGNVGFVYSAEGHKANADVGNRTKGYYYTSDTSNELTEDCRVVVSPYCKVTAASGVTINGRTYDKCSYVPTDTLNYLLGKSSKDSAKWNKIDYKTGVTIHNAVFAGGNVTRGDDKLYANTVTVYGNATATLNDVYHRDLITIGSENTGGLYGDGNLTLVDGYRELAIVNYGTDYYGLSEKITKAEYDSLSDRERAYFQLMYECKTPYDNYVLNETITEEVYKNLAIGDTCKWRQAGFCSVYAGRLLNTLQRADFVGVHGSRVVLQGAQDRVVDEVDYMEYAINRVGEVSLNKKASIITQTAGEEEDQLTHGNYFGMYSVVNYLEALTSDVAFTDTRQTKSANHRPDFDGQTYFNYKKNYINEAYRNNGNSDNKIALASGVYLELVSEESTDSNKVYGPITGVVELDLINLGDNIGGAFVYAANIHGTPVTDANNKIVYNKQAILSGYNKGAITKNGVTYGTDNYGMETSGNFVHATKQIIDDCYPGSADVSSPAHYWFLRGSIYEYDQYISAYTGSSTAYLADVQIPLTITAGSHGKLKIIAIQPNLYAYWKSYEERVDSVKLGSSDKMVIDGTTYRLNDVITYWDWSRLPSAQQKLFVRDTYIATSTFAKSGNGYANDTIRKDSVMRLAQYNDDLPDSVYIDGTKMPKSVAVHPSNATGHTTGYALTADITNPLDWDDRYVKASGSEIITTKQYNDSIPASEKSSWFQGPSYTTTPGVYGQDQYELNDLISYEVYQAYQDISDKSGLHDQATMDSAFVLKVEQLTYTNNNNVTKTLQEGDVICGTEYKTLDSNVKSSFERAYLCNSTTTVGDDYRVTGDLVTTTYYNAMTDEEKVNFSLAYICTEAGKYGGSYYAGDQNYDVLKAWCGIATEDRDKFRFNYDALDLFINDLDPDSAIASYDKTGVPYYQRELPIDYKAICNVSGGFKYTKKDSINKTTINYNDTLSGVVYESLPNEKIHYSCIVSKTAGDTVFVAKEEFAVGNKIYSVGNTVDRNTFLSLDETIKKTKIDSIQLITVDTFYYCRSSYVVNENGEGHAVKNLLDSSSDSIRANGTVPFGAVISKADYKALPNRQINFRITGTSPIETSTLYVAKDASAYDVIKDRVITLIYQYQYEESTTDGSETSLITEKHIVNIHLVFKDGAPSVGTLRIPGAVLPGTTVGLKQPTVNKGAYEIIGGGWEVYSNESDADSHINGQPYKNNSSLLYFYQDGAYVAYYAKTYLGKTYSNAVKLSVANYHDISAVMADSVHHMYIDNPEVTRNPKIYLSDDLYPNDSTRSELDLLKDLYDLSVDGTTFNSRITGCAGLDFILEDDISPEKYTTWTPLGSSVTCFGDSGYFHGDGHRIDGLSSSLFDYACNEVYNLGVTGSFTGSGIADHGGRAHNCWIWTSGTPASSTKAVMGTGVIDNCYYPMTNAYAAGGATSKPVNAFRNGEVAFNLNKFYLNKRYSDASASTLGSDVKEYKYYAINSSNKLEEKTGKYVTADADKKFPVYQSDGVNKDTVYGGYVEMRYADGDFVNAGGVMPLTRDERRSDEGNYYPIYPDDYIFFGQHLTYGLVAGNAHDSVPSSIVRTSANRLQTTGVAANRVMRAPAYFGNSTLDVAHFNPTAVLPASYVESKTHSDTLRAEYHQTDISADKTIVTTKDSTSGGVDILITTTVYENVSDSSRITVVDTTYSHTLEAYPGMTAIDFTGREGTDFSCGLASSGIFYTPALDYTGITGFNNSGQTQNMLVYANSTNDAKSYSVLEEYLYEPDYVEADGIYKNIEKVSDSEASAVHGHLLSLSGSEFVSDRDQFLVDKQDFNAPFAYGFASGKRMWYQRTPDSYMNGTGGWETIVLPFQVELVSAHDKGELTHFYGGSSTGHEYWLREYTGAESTQKAQNKAGRDSVYYAKFTSPAALASGALNVANDFLYDYYYSKSDDSNSDDYCNYYGSERSYSGYPLQSADKPYVIGFPGVRYREFDLSGSFVPENVLSTIKALERQTVTFASGAGIGVGVTDTIAESRDMPRYNDYDFVPTYKTVSISSSDAGYYPMAADGSKFDLAARDTTVAPFRAYFKASGSARKAPTRSVVFLMNGFDEESSADEFPFGLTVYAKDKFIVLESGLKEKIKVRITNAQGQTISIVEIAPGQRRLVPVSATGLYMAGRQKVMVL